MILSHLLAEIARCRGQNQNLKNEVGNLTEDAQRELFHLIQNLQQERANAERTCRPFPGGPRIRM